MFDPQKLGAACIVEPPLEGRGPLSRGDYNLIPQGQAGTKTTSADGLLSMRMYARPHAGKVAPDLPGSFFKFSLEKAPVDFLAPNEGLKSKREPYMLMHMLTKRTCVALPLPVTAVDVPVDTPAD